MKKRYVFLALIALLFSAPYLVGRMQYSNAVMVIQNLSFETDGEIEDVLRVFDFDRLTAFNEPEFIDFYKAGIYCIAEPEWSFKY